MERLSWYINDDPQILKNAILNMKGADYRCLIWNMSRSDAVNKSNWIILN